MKRGRLKFPKKTKHVPLPLNTIMKTSISSKAHKNYGWTVQMFNVVKKINTSTENYHETFYWHNPETNGSSNLYWHWLHIRESTQKNDKKIMFPT